VHLHGQAEFEAHDVTLQGSHCFEVPDGYRMLVRAAQAGGEAVAAVLSVRAFYLTLCSRAHSKTHKHKCTHACMHNTHTHTHACTHACTQTQTHARMHARMHAHTYKHTYTHIHTHTRMHAHTYDTQHTCARPAPSLLTSTGHSAACAACAGGAADL